MRKLDLNDSCAAAFELMVFDNICTGKSAYSRKYSTKTLCKVSYKLVMDKAVKQTMFTTPFFIFIFILFFTILQSF